MRNKKAQFVSPLATFLVVGVGILIIAVLMLYFSNQILTPISASFGNVSLASGQAITDVQTDFTNFWDWVVLIAFLVNIILLFVSAFLIDTHWLFVVFYIFSCFILILVAGSVTDVLDKVFDSATFVNEVANLPFADFIRTYFELIYVGVMCLSGVVIYAKIKLFGSGGGYY